MKTVLSDMKNACAHIPAILRWSLSLFGRKHLLCLCGFMALAAPRVWSLDITAEPSKGNAQVEKGTGNKRKALPESAFSRVSWTDLMPEDDLAALLSPPDYLSDIQDGSTQDQVGSQFGAESDPYQQALVSTRVIGEMDGKPIRIPGFIVPLEFDDDQTITQFFLVPYFGACIHEPPPPPNQIIFVNYPKGLKLNALYDPFWVSGVLETSIVENGVATSAYSMEMYYYEEYKEG